MRRHLPTLLERHTRIILISGCGGNFSLSIGVVSTPVYLDPGDDDAGQLICQWLITMDVGRTLTLTFLKLNLSPTDDFIQVGKLLFRGYTTL